MKLHWSLLWVPRYLTVAFGVAGLLLMYKLTVALTGRALVGLGSALLLAVNPAHVWLSSTALTEVPYATLWLAAIYGFVYFQQRASFRGLLWSAVALGMANGFRFEGWLVSAIWSVYLILYVAPPGRSGATPARLAGYLLCLGIVWTVPCLWMLSSYFQTGDALFFMSDIQAYKARWYGTERHFENYWRTVLKIDPFLPMGVGIGVTFLRFRSWKSGALAYFALAFLPFAIFIYLHAGQIEPPGNYIRYLAPFVFVAYPLIVNGVRNILVAIARKTYVRRAVVCLIVVVLIPWQVRTTFQFQNDPAAEGVDVGRKLRELREKDHDGAARDVIVELSYWQYLAIQTAANDIEHILFDRQLDMNDRTTESYFLLDLDSMRDCIAARSVELIVVRSPEIRQVIDQELGLRPIDRVNDYVFYETDEPQPTPRSAHAARCRLY